VSTIYNTPRGTTYDPLPVELWKWDGTGPEGRLETSEKIEVTWGDRGAATAVIDTPLTALSSLLVDTTAEVLVVATFNGKRHVSTVVESKIFADEDAPDDVRVQATTASAWSMLDGELLPPVPEMPLSQQQSAEEYVLSGPVETVVKALIRFGAERVGHPIVVMPDRDEGPTVEVRGRFDTVAELIEDLLPTLGYRVSLEAWLPGDETVEDFSLTRPTIIADVVPYRDNPGLVWTHAAHDIESWELVHKRASKTRVIVGDKGEGTAQKFVLVTSDSAELTPWGRREGFTTVSSEDEDATAQGRLELQKQAESVTLDATVAPSLSWEFGTDGEWDKQFDVGDWCTVQLPQIGDVRDVVTEVTVELTPVSLTVTPKVGSPDTSDRDLYALVTDIDKRVNRQMRGR
jgi:hypothetical protein